MTLRLTGIADTYRKPIGAAEIFFAQGAAAGAGGPRGVIVLGPKATGGTATANIKYRVLNSDDASTLGGIGMPVHRFALSFFQSGGGALDAIFYADPAGTAATKTIAVTGPATAAGTAHVVVCGEDCSFAFANEATADSIVVGLVAAINSKSWLPVTASGATSPITLTARVTGVCGNVNIKTRTYLDGGTGVTLGAGGDLTTGSGGTAEATAIATSLAAVAATAGPYYFCFPSAQSAADYAIATAAKTAIAARSLPNPGLRAVGIFATRDTPTNADTVAAALNYERIQELWMENSEVDCATIVGQVAAIRAKNENRDAAYNFAGYGSRGEGDWSLPGTYADSDWPTDSEQDTAINHGYTPIASTVSGSYIVLSVNTRAKTGSVYDFRATETHRVSGADYVVGRELAIWSALSAGKKIKDDQYLADGTIDPNQVIPAGVLTPSVVKTAVMKRVLREAEAEQVIVDVDQTIANMTCVKSTVNPNRFEAQEDLRVIDHAHQYLLRANEITPG